MKNINITEIIENYITEIKSELNERWNNWEKDLTESYIYEVIGGILSRQTSMSIQFAKNLNIWNGEIAPIILRSMADNHINLAWVLMNPKKNCQEFILHGLGQQKLELEHRKQKMIDDGIDISNNELIEYEEMLLNSQRYTFLTEVNLGSWSGNSTRKMAEDAGLLDFYNFVYQPFSNCTHSNWGHISKYNTQISDNPFHKFLRYPIIVDFDADLHYMGLSAKYLAKSIELFDEHFKLNVNPSIAFSNLINEFNKLTTDNNNEV
ncbi:hypothetical protein FLJC2902T_31630 [Flavobacterium limnosediminis JC2902]|uniref:Uncharacterized protein n=1 Tax=Flavobacterium limnosediminis JC2902 TaxID=1341181 RepID=V6SG48_9FLAO|nr:DUF5677 domain-containing protein [Flavobacterium limnosediminis]ESU25222.1 hypothetical protein FLJC2902T_31630 [Flavobacterium limnosediminis JC2902]